ncbi:MAG: AAA family ATPase [bacterium]
MTIEPIEKGLIGPGSRLCLSGLNAAATANVRQILIELGAEGTSFRSGADGIILPDTASDTERAEAISQGYAVFSVSELTRLARGAEEERPALEIGKKTLRILDIEIPMGSGPALNTDRFKHLCLDRLFLTTARKAALAVRHGIPCMLEGETATAKTTAILWLAEMARQHAVRVNLSGHTDTGELVGRFVPSTKTGANRPAWEFAEGYIPRALREGWWVILDEVNLAEPQVLERLNPVLELPPTLVLTEFDGRRFGSGGDVAISDKFRIFGTMNPSEYAGRATLSPAFRDRWGIWGHISKPSEPELLDMLKCLVTGESPAFIWEGVRWVPPCSEPIYPALSNFPDLDSTLKSISSFHARISGAAGDNEAPASIGRVRRERYVFTRRTLLNAMRLINENASGASRLRGVAARVMAEIYIQRLSDPADRAAALALLRATGMA